MKIIETFKKTYNLPLQYEIYFSRKLLKPIIMTINYGATFYKCKNDIRESTNLDDPEFYTYLQLFYQYVKSLP